VPANEQLSNALAPIDLTPLPIVKFPLKPVQPLKALSGILLPAARLIIKLLLPFQLVLP
jgi:hypothetical protein